MTQEVSSLYSCAVGPGVLMLIHIADGKIVQTDLEVMSEQGMHWQITGDKSKGALEKNICMWLETYCKGEQPKQKLPLDLDFLPPFTLAILEHLQTLPFGKALSYQQLAARIGSPKGARVVGNACGRNPVPLFVPCHRIIASGQRLGGFGMGISLKQRLLRFEKISVS